SWVRSRQTSGQPLCVPMISLRVAPTRPGRFRQESRFDRIGRLWSCGRNEQGQGSQLLGGAGAHAREWLPARLIDAAEKMGCLASLPGAGPGGRPPFQSAGEAGVVMDAEGVVA